MPLCSSGSSATCSFCFFFFNDTATTEIYTLSLHDALPICDDLRDFAEHNAQGEAGCRQETRSEEHTSELQSRQYLVCRLLLEKKQQKKLHLTQQKKKKILKAIYTEK